MSTAPSHESPRPPSMTVRERVFAEFARFREKLPTLIPVLGGKWVVFRDGEVQSVHDDLEAAYEAGVSRFGRDGGMVVAEVREEEILEARAW